MLTNYLKQHDSVQIMDINTILPKYSQSCQIHGLHTGIIPLRLRFAVCLQLLYRRASTSFTIASGRSTLLVLHLRSVGLISDL